MKITAILHASLLVEHTERALHFYRDALGLEVCELRPDLGYPGAWLQLNETQQIHLLELPSPDPREGRPAHGGRDRHIALGIEDLDRLIAKLEAAQVPYILSRSGRRAVFCRDPDGNALEFIAAAK